MYPDPLSKSLAIIKFPWACSRGLIVPNLESKVVDNDKR